MPSEGDEFNVYDEERSPPEWNSLLSPGQCAVFRKDPEPLSPLDSDGNAVATRNWKFFRFNHLEDARRFCEVLVERHPSICCEVFDSAGKAKPPLLTVVHGIAAQRDEL